MINSVIRLKSESIVRQQTELYNEIMQLVQIIRDKIVECTEIVWTRYDDVEELRSELDSYIERLRNKDASVCEEVNLLFAPTGSFQELSISNGWADEYLELAAKFDRIYLELKK